MVNIFFRNVLVLGILIIFLMGSFASGFTVNIKNSFQQSSSGTLYVGGDGPGNYTKIQYAIDNASIGDTIRVCDGFYNESINIYKRINLIGNGSLRTIINGDFLDHQHVVYISANRVNLSGFSIINSYMGHEFGGIGVQSTNNRIFDNYCRNNLYGIILFGGNNRIFNNTFSYNERTGIYIKSSGNIIDNNYCANSYDNTGIWLNICTDNIITNNVCSNNDKNGISLYQSHNNSIYKNTCTNSVLYGGILIYESSNNEISENTLSYNNDAGIAIYYFSDYNLVSNNLIQENRIGVTINDDCSFNAVYYNDIISNNEKGIYIDSSSYNMIYHNNLIANQQNAFDEGFNTWDKGYPGCGNYWDDYPYNDDNHGPNQDIPGHDRIGDVPYDLPFEHATDYFPVMHKNGWLNEAPENLFLDGPSNGKAGQLYTYVAIAEDPDLDPIYYNFSWGDGLYSDWLGPYISGTEASDSHSWSKGTYEIKVKARDTRGLESDRSYSIVVSMPRNKLYNFDLLEKLFNRFSDMYQI